MKRLVLALVLILLLIPAFAHAGGYGVASGVVVQRQQAVIVQRQAVVRQVQPVIVQRAPRRGILGGLFGGRGRSVTRSRSVTRIR